jgi:hypothetical protein
MRGGSHWIALVAAVLCLAAQPAAATLVITNSSIVGGHYVYDLTFNETANNTVLNADALSVTRLTCYVDNWNPGTTLHEVIAYYTNSTSAGLVYKFDFSQTNYRPSSFALREAFTLFNNIHGHDLTLAWSGWSTDNVTWTTVTSFTTPQGTTYGGGTVTNYTSPALSWPSVVYYKMSMTTQPGDGDGVLTADHNQWNRIDSSNANAFRADFTMTMVPEPATCVLLATSIAACALLVRGRARKAP